MRLRQIGHEDCLRPHATHTHWWPHGTNAHCGAPSAKQITHSFRLARDLGDATAVAAAEPAAARNRARRTTTARSARRTLTICAWPAPRLTHHRVWTHALGA